MLPHAQEIIAVMETPGVPLPEVFLEQERRALIPPVSPEVPFGALELLKEFSVAPTGVATAVFPDGRTIAGAIHPGPLEVL